MYLRDLFISCYGSCKYLCFSQILPWNNALNVNLTKLTSWYDFDQIGLKYILKREC